VELQRAALQNRAAFTRAALAGEQDQMIELNGALEPVSAELAQLEPKANAAAEKCGGGKGGG
jgi:uncharacterized membrane protein